MRSSPSECERQLAESKAKRLETYEAVVRGIRALQGPVYDEAGPRRIRREAAALAREVLGVRFNGSPRHYRNIEAVA